MKTTLLLMLGCMAMPAMAQTAQTSDATWCDIIRRVLLDQGHQSEVRCDYDGTAKTLHVGVDGFIRTYDVPNVRQSARDYSSAVYVIVERPDYESPYYHSMYSSPRPGQVVTGRRGNETVPADHYTAEIGRTWHSYSTSNRPETAYDSPRDVDRLHSTLQENVNKLSRIQLVDADYGRGIAGNNVPLLILRTKVTDIQRGERYTTPSQAAAIVEKGKPAAAPAAPKLSRTYAYINVTISLVDYHTGEVLWTKTVEKANDTSSVNYTDPMTTCIGTVASAVSNQLSALYPTKAPRPVVSGYVLRAEKVRKEKAETVYIDMGSAQELERKERLTVYLITSIDGNEGQTEIGTLSVDAIQGPTLTLCDVKRGEKDIYAALQRGDRLAVRSK